MVFEYFWINHPALGAIFRKEMPGFIEKKSSSDTMHLVSMYCDPRSELSLDEDIIRAEYINNEFSKQLGLFDPKNEETARVIQIYSRYIPEPLIVYRRLHMAIAKMLKTAEEMPANNPTESKSKADLITKINGLFDLLIRRRKDVAACMDAIDEAGVGGYVPSRMELGHIGT